MITLDFVGGTLEIRGLAQQSRMLEHWCRWDARARCHRAAAEHYAPIVLCLRDSRLALDDRARRYRELALSSVERREPRPFQREALASWLAGGGRGVVVLPTGAGKSYLAMMAIDARRRSSLVVAPTLDLVHQWYQSLRACFAAPVGVIGGGEYQLEDLTVTTYDSAYARMEHIGARFGLVIFDECHHLPGESYALAARFCLAPYRLGLTATPERADGRERLLEQLIGPTLYRRDVVELSGRYLAPYETIRVDIELEPDEREEYEGARATYLAFLRRHGIAVNSPAGWGQFVIRASRGEEGRAAMQGYQRQRQIAFGARGKLACVARLLHRHRRDRCLVFTQDNATAYAISRRFLIPALTHQTKVTERSAILEGFAGKLYGAIVTSKVLNEGVDVPRANVAIVVSGSGSVREHVQRLGRVLRKQRGKRALLYELVTAGTSEKWTSARRRDHVAYR
jgi:superfamily II DNA or RNA helicase